MLAGDSLFARRDNDVCIMNEEDGQRGIERDGVVYSPICDEQYGMIEEGWATT